ncbi:winged helix-turn-helix transcriptional regulator [Lentzea fradiae]|uniref:winged helix-turn-helix transcriptional regulator n=1 Tax=Lentzea fradiae TaxID=200378 RepID=UPI001FE1B67B|nr:helix-turn-helix domain-containing protein [Lentzea fradiae]
MKRRDYAQYCGIARALELVGERWALLVVRDLTVRPRRYTDLQEGLRGIPTNVLSTRLKELEQAGIVERRVAPAPRRGVVYTLTEVGRALEPALIALGRWGSSQLGEPQPGYVASPDGAVLNLRGAFQPSEAAGLTASWELRLGDTVIHARLADGALTSGLGPVEDGADLVITARFEEGEPPAYRSFVKAAREGRVDLDGPRELFDTFLRVFTYPQACERDLPTPR